MPHNRTNRTLLVPLFLVVALVLAAPPGLADPPSGSQGNANPPPDTRCDEVTCVVLRLDDDVNPYNRLDTQVGDGAADALYWGDARVLTAGADLDAGLLDGLDSSQFLRSDKSGTLAGNLAVTGLLGVGTTMPLQTPHQTGNHLSSDGQHWLVNNNAAGNPYLFFESGDPWGPSPTTVARGYVGVKGPDNRGASFCPEDPQGYLCIRADSRAISLTADGGNTRQVTLMPNGNVGIGTTATFEPLRVKGAGYSQGSLGADGNLLGIVTAIPSSNSGVMLGGTSTGNDGAVWTTASGADLLFGTFVDGAPKERMRIANNGNVGIGTANPTEKLHTSASGTVRSLVESSGGDARMDVRTTSQRSFAVADFLNDVGDEAQIYVGGSATGQRRLTVYGSASLPIGLYAGGANPAIATPHLLVATNGNVGIGTSSPTAKLAVAGGARVDALQVDPTSLGTCDAATRGTMRFVAAGSGEADQLYLCRKDASDAFGWVDVA